MILIIEEVTTGILEVCSIRKFYLSSITRLLVSTSINVCYYHAAINVC
jgi:hypothetical protein